MIHVYKNTYVVDKNPNLEDQNLRKLLSMAARPPQAGPQVQRHTGSLAQTMRQGPSPSAQRGAAFTRPHWSSPAAPRSRLGSWQGHHRGHPHGPRWLKVEDHQAVPFLWKEAKDAMKKGTPWRASGNGHPIHLLPLLWKESIL